jgi:hypothetical protein
MHFGYGCSKGLSAKATEMEVAAAIQFNKSLYIIADIFYKHTDISVVLNILKNLSIKKENIEYKYIIIML